jgi:transposase
MLETQTADAMNSVGQEGHGFKFWIEAAKKRLHHNVLAIALANKLPRIAWSVLARGRAFEASKLQAE